MKHTATERPGPGVPSASSIDGRTRARALGWLYIAGATIGLIGMLLPHSAKANDAALYSNIALAYAGGVAILLIGPRMKTWFFQAALVIGTLIITRAVLDSGETVSFYAVWYIWIGLYAFYFFTRATAAVQVGFVAVIYGATLLHEGTNSPIARWLTTVATLVVAGVFIDTLVTRARRQAAASAHAAHRMTTVVDVAHELASQSDSDAARPALCDAAARTTGAASVILWEPGGDGTSLEAKATAGDAPARLALPFVGPRAGAMQAFTAGTPVEAVGFDARGLSPEFDGDGSYAGACLWQPVLRDDGPVAVLGFRWPDAAALADGGLAELASLLAVETAVTLERVDLLARLEAVARTDDLTGLPNRRAWQEELPREVLRASREAWPLCIAMLDLDHFKHFNDMLGHQAGDRLLKQAAAAWSAELRGTDFLARYGGEEFALALPGCAPEESFAVVERLRAATPGGQTCSAGIACWDGAESAALLLGRADVALYQAKHGGRNQTVLDGAGVAE